MTYKLVVRTHEMWTTAITTYSSELVRTHAPSETLRSYNATMLVIPRIHSKLVHHTFSVAAPSTWNYLLTFDCAITLSLSNAT